MHQRRPPGRVALIYVAASAERISNRINAILLMTDRMPFVHSIDYRRYLRRREPDRKQN